MTDLKTLKQLVKLMVDNDLTELDLEGEGEKIKLRRGNAGPEVQYVTGANPAAASTQTSAQALAQAQAYAPASTPAGADAAEEHGITINSPLVGTFYLSPTPDAKPFVSVGDNVDDETVVCIIEAMKVFNEIKAEQNGTIEKVLVGNGQAVEFGQPLFVIHPN